MINAQSVTDRREGLGAYSTPGNFEFDASGAVLGWNSKSTT